jgi:hypothetical protein
VEIDSTDYAHPGNIYPKGKALAHAEVIYFQTPAMRNNGMDALSGYIE